MVYLYAYDNILTRNMAKLTIDLGLETDARD